MFSTWISNGGLLSTSFSAMIPGDAMDVHLEVDR